MRFPSSLGNVICTQCCVLMHTLPCTNYTQKSMPKKCSVGHLRLPPTSFILLVVVVFTCMSDVLLRIIVAPRTGKDFSSPSLAVKSRQAQRNRLAFIVQINEFTARLLKFRSPDCVFPFVSKRILKDCTLNPYSIWKWKDLKQTKPCQERTSLILVLLQQFPPSPLIREEAIISDNLGHDWST